VSEGQSRTCHAKHKRVVSDTQHNAQAAKRGGSSVDRFKYLEEKKKLKKNKKQRVATTDVQ
jgi:hypothetical protein